MPLMEAPPPSSVAPQAPGPPAGLARTFSAISSSGL